MKQFEHSSSTRLLKLIFRGCMVPHPLVTSLKPGCEQCLSSDQNLEYPYTPMAVPSTYMLRFHHEVSHSSNQ
uniref:Uncharacterized protein n=1 Tax=Arundo donax TaxID=35708 RepID=A0A0A9G290_ARUDO